MNAYNEDHHVLDREHFWDAVQEFSRQQEDHWTFATTGKRYVRPSEKLPISAYL